MIRTMMKSKIHGATVTEANLKYVGSITIDQDILDVVDIIPNELVHIANNNNGYRFETYVIPGERGKGTICLNGASARLFRPGDKIIIISYGQCEDVSSHVPTVIILDEKNQVKRTIPEEHGKKVGCYDLE